MSDMLTETLLIELANKLAGRTLSEFFDENTIKTWHNTYSKGAVGQLLERLLGATSHSKPQPDFYDLGIELKSIPLDSTGKPLESTYVCHSPFPCKIENWMDSLVYQKLKKVLWIPIIGPTKTPLYFRQIGTPILWQMSPTESNALEEDWLELNELMLTGQHDVLSAAHGQYLHCRPKAQNSDSQVAVSLCEGTNILVVPKGYYLRTAFTRRIIHSHYGLDL